MGQGGRRGPRRPGGGARGAQKAPRGRRPGEDAWKSKTMCVVGLGGGQGRAAKGLGFLKITWELTPRGLSPGSYPPPQRSFLCSLPLVSRAPFPPIPPAFARAPPLAGPPEQGPVRSPLHQLWPPGSDPKVGPAWPSSPARRGSLGRSNPAEPTPSHPAGLWRQ